MDETTAIAIKEFFKGRKSYIGSVKKVPKEPGDLRETHLAISRFFRNKSWHCGGPVPPELLHTKRNWFLVNNIDLISSIEIGYRKIDQQKCLARTKWDKHADTRMCLRVARECERKCIPQKYIGGLFLLYLELCERVEIA